MRINLADVGLDLSGGYFDAGDHVKFGQPGATSFATLAWAGVEFEQAFRNAGQWDDLQKVVRIAMDYYTNCHVEKNEATDKLYVQVGEGGSANDHGYWGPAEEMPLVRKSFAITASAPGSDVACDTSAAMAAASTLYLCGESPREIF